MSRAVYSYFEKMEMPCSEIEKTLITEAADDFSDQIAIDVKNFILQLCMESIAECPRKVIVFPEVNELGEVLIDEIVKIFPNLISFVVGPTKTKRIVVCSHAIVKNKVLQDLATGETVNSESKKAVHERKSTQEVVTTTNKVDSNSTSSLLSGTLPEASGVSATAVDSSDKIPVVDDTNYVQSRIAIVDSPTTTTTNCNSSGNNDDEKITSSMDDSQSSIECSTEPPVDVHLKNKNIVSEGRSKVIRKGPDEGTFRRVMNELYIAADRHHRPVDKMPASTSSNNWTRNLRNSPQDVSSTTSRPAAPIFPAAHPSPSHVSEKSSSSSSDEEKGVPSILNQPEEDMYWKKLACAHLNEIYCILGSVEIVKPKWKQISYDMQISLKEHALGHILETYNMDERIVTRDLTLMFSAFKTSGFNIKWVDSSKALVVFSSAKKAAEALLIDHPVIKTRPVLIASRESKLRILQCSQYLLPYKDRPKTVATVARRMISNSLGIFPKVEVHPEVIEKERNIIEQARAEKLLKEKKSKEKIIQGAPPSTKTEECEDNDKSDWMKFDFS